MITLDQNGVFCASKKLGSFSRFLSWPQIIAERIYEIRLYDYTYRPHGDRGFLVVGLPEADRIRLVCEAFGWTEDAARRAFAIDAPGVPCV